MITWWKKIGPYDKIFLGITGSLVGLGLLIFFSASLSILAKDESQFIKILFNQLGLGFIVGSLAFYAMLHIDYKLFKQYALWILIASVVLLVCVFIPGVGAEYHGAKRWLDLGPFSFQPVEFTKIALVIYLSAWFAWIREKISNFWWGPFPLIILLGIIGGILLMQPDTGQFLVMSIAAIGIYFVAGAQWKHIIAFLLLGLVGLGIMVAMRPYLLDRFETFINLSSDPLGESWQVRQSLNAIGSGRLFGRGYGQSVQKFNYLPEPAGDSVYAVIGEEFGFVGSVLILLLYVTMCLRGFWIALRVPDAFGRYMIIGILILIISQSFMNIASSLALFPLSGDPLVFISQGGTSLLFALIEVGMIVNISQYKKWS